MLCSVRTPTTETLRNVATQRSYPPAEMLGRGHAVKYRLLFRHGLQINWQIVLINITFFFDWRFCCWSETQQRPAGIGDPF